MADEQARLDKKIEDLHVQPAPIDRENMEQDPDTEVFMLQDRAAVQLVLTDTEMAENFINVLQWASAWTLADTLYQSPATLSAFDGGNVAQANVPKFMISNHISAIVPKLVGGIFYEDPCFLLRPRASATQEMVRAKTALFSYQLWETHFEEEAERMMNQMALLGTGIMKWGYANYTDKQKRYVRKASQKMVDTPAGPVQVDTPDSDDFELVHDSVLISRPWIKFCDIRTVLVDPGCRVGNIQTARYVVYRDYATYDDLNQLREVPGYDIPAEDVLKELFMRGKDSTPGNDNIDMTIPEGMRGYIQHAVPRNYKTTADPLQNGLEILERWDKDRVIVVLSCNQHNILIRNDENPYGKIPFFSANWRDIPDSFYGQGIGILIGSEQLIEQGVTNLALDLLAYGLQPTAIRKKGFNTPTQITRWKLGGIIDVDDDVDKSFKFMTMPPVPTEAWAFIQQAQASGASTSGSNELIGQGGTLQGARSTGMRSGTGAAAVVAAQASRLDGPEGRFIRQVFEPWLYQMDELNNQLLPTSVLKRVLGQELGKDFNAAKFDHIEFRNAAMDFEVLAGAHLGAKREMAQFLPFVVQLLNNPTFAQSIAQGGYVFDGVAIFKAFADAAGWKFSQSFMREMTPQEKQRQEMNSPAAMQQRQLQAQQALQLQKFQQEQQLEDQEQMGKAAGEVNRQVVEHALQSESVEGEPGNTGFGDITNL